MTHQRREDGRPDTGNRSRSTSPAVSTKHVTSLSGSMLGNGTVLALAALAGSAGLGELLGLAGVPDAAAVRSASNGRRGEATGRLTGVDILRCRVTWRLVAELFAAACKNDLPEGAARRRPRCHIRQIAMYLSHVVLSVPYQTIATAFGRDRTTVMHACSVVEDRRDDAGYDRFVEQCERCIEAVFAPLGQDDAEL